MRGCLVTIAVLILVVGLTAWFLLPPAAGAIAEGALVAAGIDSDTRNVTVESDPPLRLLTLTADAVRIRATNVRFRGLEAASADITFDGVAVLDRSFKTLDGTLNGVHLQPSYGPELSVPLVHLTGTPDRVRATLDLPAADAEALASAAVQDAVGIAPSRVVFGAPDRVSMTVGGRTVNGRLAVAADGSLALIAPAGSPVGAVALVSPAAGLPIRVESFRIVDGGLTLVVTIDPGLQ